MKRDIAQKTCELLYSRRCWYCERNWSGQQNQYDFQAAFFKIANIIPIDDAVKYMKKLWFVSYGKKGEQVVNQNYAAIDQGIANVKKVDYPASWAEAARYPRCTRCDAACPNLKSYVEEVLIPANAQKGDDITVSTLAKWVDGALPQGTAAFEKRGAADDVPERI